MRIRFSLRAQADPRGIYRFIARDNVAAARDFSAALKRQVARLGLNPEAYRSRPELGHGVRVCPFGRYLVLYVIEGDVLRVLSVPHSAMDIGGQMEP